MGPLTKDKEVYTCSLSSETLEVARRELREDQAVRDHALQLMRQWIAKHPDIRNCRTDAVFLLRFLRSRKFSIPQAQEMLERLLAIREVHAHWFRKLDVNNPIVHEIFDCGYIVPLPERDSFGRQVILTCVGRLDPHKYTVAQVIHAHSIVSEVIMDDEETHVNGVVHIADASNLSMSHLSMWSLNDLRTIIGSIEKSLPMRLKGTHIINLPTLAKQMFDFFASLHSEKLRNRLNVHASLEEFKKDFEVKILPKEYGGEVSMADMISQFKKKAKSREATIRALEESTFILRPGSHLSTELVTDDTIFGVTGSFRKLDVD